MGCACWGAGPGPPTVATRSLDPGIPGALAPLLSPVTAQGGPEPAAGPPDARGLSRLCRHRPPAPPVRWGCGHMALSTSLRRGLPSARGPQATSACPQSSPPES